MQDFPSAVSNDNSINSKSNILSKSPPRFPAVDTKATMDIKIPKKNYFLLFFYNKNLILPQKIFGSGI